MDLKFKDNNKLKLSLFTKLEYIESSGTQYINTGFKPVVDDEFEITYMITGTKGSFNSVFGTRVNTWSNAFMFGYTSSGSYIEIGSQNINSFNKGYSQNVKHIIKLESGNLYVDDVLDRSITINQNTVHNLLLFTLNDNGTPSEFGKCRIYNFTIKRAGVKVLDLIPANKDNVLCMYDIVSKTFFYNQGTGDFIAGQVVEPALPETILLKTTTLYHKNTPNIDGLQLLDYILSAQETAEDIVLNRIRVDIGNVSGSLSELMQYASMAGFNDNYEPQTKPRLVGTWTINDWYTTSQLTQAQAVFDGLTIVGDPTKVLDFTQMAVQVLDPNEDNYNPAVAIILQGHNLGTTIPDAPLGNGRWFISKNQAAAVTDISNWFYNKSTVTDTNSLVTTDATRTYDFESFDEFEYFGCTYIGINFNNNSTYGFCNCSKLEHIKLPNNITINIAFAFCSALKNVTFPQTFYLGDGGNNFRNTGLESIDLSNCASMTLGANFFYSCSLLKNIILPQTITAIYNSAFQLVGNNATFTEDDTFDLNLPNLTTIGDSAFENCYSLTSITSLGSITTIPNSEVFVNTPRLKTVVLPNTLITIGARAFSGSAIKQINLPNGLEEILNYAFNETRNLKITSIPQSITKIGPGSFRYSCVNDITASDRIDVQLPNIGSTSDLYQLFENCKIIDNILDLGAVTSFSGDCCTNCSAKLIVVPSTVTSFGYQRNLPSNCIIHLLAATPPTVGANNNYITPTSVKIYVGDGSSAVHDDAILADYLADTNWATYSSRLDTWYNYLHPTT